jgi:4a-hydroxytetrahydrobiopterin dehydratase
MNDLATLHCLAMEGQPPLSAADVELGLSQAPGWALVDGAIEKRFGFADFHRTMAFVNAVAWVAHMQDHHPDMQIGFDHCTLRFNTHAVRGISRNDFICAARVDALLP